MQSRTIKHLNGESVCLRRAFCTLRPQMMDPKVVNLLRTHADFLELKGSRVVCSLNDHSLPATVQAIQTFVK